MLPLSFLVDAPIVLFKDPRWYLSRFIVFTRFSENLASDIVKVTGIQTSQRLLVDTLMVSV